MQGLRQASALGSLLQNHTLFYCSHTASSLVSATLTIISSALAAGLRPGNQDRAVALKAISTSLAGCLRRPHSQQGEAQVSAMQSLVAGMGYRPADLDEAIHKVLMLGTADNALPGSNDAHGSAACTSTTSLLERVLEAAVRNPSGHCVSGLTREVQTILIPVLRCLELQDIGLSKQGWMWYMQLDAQAIIRVLEATLHAAVAADHPSALVANAPHLAAALEAISSSTELHKRARQLLHCWLAASGNMKVWELLHQLLRSAMAHCQDEKRNLDLPDAIKALYAPELHRVADAMLSYQYNSPDHASLAHAGGMCVESQTVHKLEPCMEDVSRCLTLLGQAETAMAKAAGNDDAIFSEFGADAAWHLVLDAQALLKVALAALPWEALEKLIPEQFEGRASAERASAGGLEEGGSCPCPPAAVEWLARLMWPHSVGQRAVLEDLLRLEWGNVDVVSVRPWVEVLLGWRREFSVRNDG